MSKLLSSNTAGNPPYGPKVSKVVRSIGKLTIFWKPLSDNQIKSYKVCYDKTEALIDQCERFKFVNKEKTKVDLRDLEVVTDYYIGIKVSYDGHNYGELGDIIKEKSCECSKRQARKKTSLYPKPNYCQLLLSFLFTYSLKDDQYLPTIRKKPFLL